MLGKRADGYHALDSLVAFAGCAADALTLAPGPDLALDVDGPFADAVGGGGDNLVIKAAREAAARIDRLTLGRFALTKRIPVAAGLGGGSADAAAALRLIAEANELGADDPRIVAAAEATGSDVPVCLRSRAARMTGRGETVTPIEGFEPLAAVLANPLKAVSTAEIFRRLGLKPGDSFDPADRGADIPPRATRGEGGPAHGAASGGALVEEFSPEPHPTRPRFAGPPSLALGEGCPRASFDALLLGRNDLESPARALLPEIGEGLAALASSDGCRLARMSGSGATVFALFADQREARRAARALKPALPGWWLAPTMLR